MKLMEPWNPAGGEIILGPSGSGEKGKEVNSYLVGLARHDGPKKSSASPRITTDADDSRNYETENGDDRDLEHSDEMGSSTPNDGLSNEASNDSAHDSQVPQTDLEHSQPRRSTRVRNMPPRLQDYYCHSSFGNKSEYHNKPLSTQCNFPSHFFDAFQLLQSPLHELRKFIKNSGAGDSAFVAIFSSLKLSPELNAQEMQWSRNRLR
nr:uncharacterized protein LOC109147362 [Ipomoea batatas]